MAGSKTKRISDARARILNTLCEYMQVAQAIDLRKEDDFDDLESEVDVILEELMFKQER